MRFGALKSDSPHHFFRNACTKSGSLRFSQFSSCWLILSVYILMSFEFPFVRLFGVRLFCYYPYLHNTEYNHIIYAKDPTLAYSSGDGFFYLCLLLPFLHNSFFFVDSTLFQFRRLIYITLTIEQFQPHNNPEGGLIYILW